MQQNFIRKLDQQIEKTEEDKNVQEKCREDQREQEETFEIAALQGHGGMKKQQKTKAGRGTAGYSELGGFMEKQPKGGEVFELGTFDSDPHGKFGGSNNFTGQVGKKNRGGFDSSFKSELYPTFSKKGT